MPTGMLGKLRLSDIRGPRDALEVHLAGDSGEQWLQQLNRFVQKRPTWEDKRHFAIDCDKLPKHGSFGELITHQRQGMWRWDHGRVELYQLAQQQDRLNLPSVRQLYEAVQSMRPANTCVLNYLFDYDELIPESWKSQGKAVYFMGTLFADNANSDLPNARVRGMKWSDRENSRNQLEWLGKMAFLNGTAGPDMYALLIKAY